MKVHEFAKLLGLPDSKVRYYDRSGLIRGGRQKENNYRDFTREDALNIYHASMLRSFDMGVQEALSAKNQELSVIDGWVEEHAGDLERQIAWEEMRLQRLREMQAYFSLIQTRREPLSQNLLDDSFNVWNFGKVAPLSPSERKAIELLARNMPFSYIAIRVSRESLLRPGDELDVSIGLGILEKNRAKLGLDLPPEIPRYTGGILVNQLLELHDPFALTKKDIAPLLSEFSRRGLTWKSDLIGRFFISYMKNGSFVHGVGLGFSMTGQDGPAQAPLI